MPHIIVEQSGNLPAPFNMTALMNALHQEALRIDAFPIGGMRLRAYTPDISIVGDGAPENAFIYIYVRIGQGRDEATKKDLGARLFSVLTEYCESLPDSVPLSLGLEIEEINSALTWKKNNIHQILKGKSNV